MFFDKIQPLYFFIAFTAGIFYCYLVTPRPEIVVKFPTPYNANNVVYKAKNDTCFKVDASKVKCPVDKNLIKMQPLDMD